MPKQAAKAAGLPIYQIMVHGQGKSHHQTWKIGNRVMQACMAGLPTDGIVKEFTGMENAYPHMGHVATEIRQESGGNTVEHDQTDTD